MDEKELILNVLESQYMLNNKIENMVLAFGTEWFNNADIDLKINILVEAINNKIKVNEVSDFKKIREYE